MDLVVTVCWWGERDSSIILAKSIPKFWQAKLLKETDGETIDVTMDSYHDIEMRNELWMNIDEVWCVHHHGCRVGMMTYRIACWRAPPQTRCRGGDLFIHVSLGQLCIDWWEELLLFYTFAGTIYSLSENRSAAISMWFKSNTHIQPTPLLCPRFQFLFRVDVQNFISMVVIWACIEIHNVQGYLWLEMLMCNEPRGGHDLGHTKNETDTIRWWYNMI